MNVGTEGIPEDILKAVNDDRYDKGDCDISVTTLIDSPQIARLAAENPWALERSAADRVIAMYGSGVHLILSRYLEGREDVVSERRFYGTFSGRVLSGQIDKMKRVQSGNWRISDYKVVRAASVMDGSSVRFSWEKQLNCYRVLAVMNGFEVDSLSIIAIIRDWHNNGKRTRLDYPSQPAVEIEIPIWGYHQAVEYINKRMKLHFDGVTECSDEEMWKRDPVYAVHSYTADNRKLRDRAMRLFKSGIDAESYILENGIKGEVIERPGEYARCEGNYCGVSSICGQFKRLKGE